MGYYMGDFYAAPRMYRGDPGFFSFLGGLAKKAVGFIPGVGPAIKTGLEMIPTKKAAPLMTAGREIVAKAGRTIAKHPVLSAAGAAGAIAAGAGAAAGVHRLMAGGRKHRRMNVYNPRALRRALRRTKGFAKMARQIVRVDCHYKHPKKFHIGHFTKKSRKK